ncbi:MAG: restriction endonuclease S subunit [Dehalococcoides mccartyi]|uniref:restriction endonuclease subunit S n=1 Tax=Dehalococcoides mccartyi TaxID=61435 RepID=UPI00242AAE48|nr:restriction endonuclease subunit S [Dehalococcoides mccartyi]MCF7635009.1 restriction endonuclease S subunit [Dehalococcoides mccartyi]
MEISIAKEQPNYRSVPQGWKFDKIGNIAIIHRGASPRPISDKRWFSENSEVGWVRITDVSKAHKYLLETEQQVSDDGMKNSRFVKENSLIMSICATVGKPIITRTKVCIHDGFVVFEGLRDNLDYVYYYLSFVEDEWAKHGQTGSQMNLNTGIIGDEIILLPNDPKEQSAIAEALSDADTLIASLEKLIDKKKSIKHGAMQILLTGKKRLPGFTEEWTNLNMAEKSTLKARIGWQGLTTAEYLESGQYLLVTGTDFQNGRINWSSCWFVDKSRYMQDTNILLKPKDVLLTKDGTIGKVGYVDSLPRPATLNSGVFVIRPKNNAYNPLYFYYVLDSHIFSNFLAKLQAGSTISHLYQKDFVNFNFMAPEIEEQSAIASILSDMDTEIDELEHKLAKYKLIKQGMMQELLTGKKRLV